MDISVFILQVISVVIAGIVAGGAWAYTLEIHPALVKASPKSSLDLFTPMFNHANVLQPLLGLGVAMCTFCVSWLTSDWLWFAGGIVMQLVGPYTIFGMMPLNRRLMDSNANPESSETLEDLKNWGKLHAVRTFINTSTFVFLSGLAIWPGH